LVVVGSLKRTAERRRRAGRVGKAWTRNKFGDAFRSHQPQIRKKGKSAFIMEMLWVVPTWRVESSLIKKR